jgi:hypothetical protein
MLGPHLRHGGATNLPLPLRERIASPHKAKPSAWTRLVRGDDQMHTLLLRKSRTSRICPLAFQHSIRYALPATNRPGALI